MPAAKKLTWIVQPVDNSKAPFEIEAETYEYDAASGRHYFKNGDLLVGNLLNVSVVQKP